MSSAVILGAYQYVLKGVEQQTVVDVQNDNSEQIIKRGAGTGTQLLTSKQSVHVTIIKTLNIIYY